MVRLPVGRRGSLAAIAAALATGYVLMVIVFMSKELKSREPQLNGVAAVFISVAYLYLYAMLSVLKCVLGVGFA